ncbi:UNVERIFIED_CONTAM: Transcription factor [Sesamum radiatum]|uniref:Transcription factor n=1 Tax=Sesamum radiatum TaxID=300843 RepID=A0AAW2MXV1_SESRA
MKKKVNNSTDANNGEVPKQKERHIVSWSQEEDDILREQIRLHGTEKWFTYLNSDFKRGGWSPEEDMLLCEAQKIFGNRWTEIAKVVSGRCYWDQEPYIVTFIGARAYISSTAESEEDKLAGECAIADHLLRAPFAVLAQNVHGFKVNLPTQLHGSHIKEASTDGSESDRSQGTFLRKDDPKLLALMQQAELLSSLAIKVNSEKTDQSLESAWLNPDTDFQFEKFKELVEDLRSCNEGSRPSWREPDLYESSPASSEYSTGSTQLSNVPSDKSEECQAEICLPRQETGLQSNQLANQKGLAEEHGMSHTANTKNEVNMLACNDVKDDDVVCEYSSTEFGSPVHVTPIFRALAATIPSPKFSESEKHFLMKTLGMESTSPSPITNPSQPPQCKSNLDLSFSRIGLRRSAFGSRVLWSILLFLLKIDRYHLHPRV